MTIDVQWWCSARGEPWSWRWQAYPGVWLSIVAIACWVRRWSRRAHMTRSDVALAVSGVLLLWLTLDWPVGPLGAGYLASVHTLQFVSLAIVAPPLLLASMRRGIRSRFDATNEMPRWILWATQPIVAAVAFTIAMVATHAPLVVDLLMRRQLGAFALDVTWFASGVLLWWPVIVRRPNREWFNPLLQMLDVFMATQAHLGIAMWLLVADFPVYATYELAPRVTSLSAIADQQIAGGIMIGVVEPIVLGVITVIFFRWTREIEAREAQLRVGGAERALLARE